MAAKQKTIFVYDDFSSEQPVLMGILYVNVIKGGELCPRNLFWLKYRRAMYI